MNRRSGVVVGVVVVIAGLGLLGLRWRCDHGPRSAPPAAGMHGDAPAMTARTRIDPVTLARGSINGTVHDEGGAPIAGARVCANATDELLPASLRALRCVITNDQGHYKVADLVAASYLVHASARQFRPGAFHPTPGANRHDFPLAPGETRTGADVELKRGGVEITGTVSDASGGPIARAQVEASREASSHVAAAVDTDEQGRFALWVDRGPMTLEGRADGYAPNQQAARAPGRYEIVLTPASSIAGRVVDAATGEPVAGAHVELATEQFETFAASESTDAQGAFRVEHLTPGRYTAIATAEHGYGHSEGSLLVGLGQQIDGALVRMFPARRVAGKVVIAGSGQRCPEGTVVLHDAARPERSIETTERDGWWVADSLRPGTYSLSVYCTGHQRRDRYAPIVVGNEDVTGLVWEVDPGARIRGKVVTRSGDPIEGVVLYVITGNDMGVSGVARSGRDGRFEAGGLPPGTYRINARSDRGTAPPEGFSVTVAAGATVERDLVLDDTGTLAGTVIDSAGVPVPDVNIFVSAAAGSMFSNNSKSDIDGAFTVDGLPPGTYQIVVMRDLGVSVRSVGPLQSTGHDPVVTVVAGQTATAKVVLEATSGTIQGTVVDDAGAPISDAFVASARESEGAGASSSEVARTREDWSGRNKPVLTSTDGRFQLTRLSPGKYTVRAFRKGGGEAIAEHVAVGSTARLQITPTGSIAGTARRKAGAPPQDLRISLHDPRTHYRRTEDFYMSGGHFVMRDLPAGHFELVAEADDSRASSALDLGAGENKTGADLELASLVALTGRIVEHGTQKPVPGMRVSVMPLHGAAERYVTIDGEDTESVTDGAGRFTVRRVPVGALWIRAQSQNMESSELLTLDEARQVSGTGTIDVGDLRLVRPRIKRGDPIGVLGLGLAMQPGLPAEQRAFKISSIAAGGPAARTALQVGDVITSCDGVDVTGVGLSNWSALTLAPPGTTLTLGTQRGITVTIVLAPR